MNYDRIILELMDRVKTLEEEVKELKKEQSFSDDEDEIDFDAPLEEFEIKKPMTQKIREWIKERKEIARKAGQKELVLNCNDIQKIFNISNRTPLVCSAMYKVMEKGDVVLSAPPSGFSTTVTVKYLIK